MILVGTSKLCRACSKLLPTRRDVSKKGYPFDITGLTIFIFINPSSSFCLSVLLIARRTRSVSSVNDYKSSPRFPSQVQMWTQLIWSIKKWPYISLPFPTTGRLMSGLNASWLAKTSSTSRSERLNQSIPREPVLQPNAPSSTWMCANIQILIDFIHNISSGHLFDWFRTSIKFVIRILLRCPAGSYAPPSAWDLANASSVCIRSHCTQ